MIRHRPLGSGHPYCPDTEQRWPIHPVAGEPLTLGVRTSGNVSCVTADIQSSQGSDELSLSPVPRSSRGQSSDGGHLANAQARRSRTAGGWQVEVPVAPPGEFSYRFLAVRDDGNREMTRWFTCRTGVWEPAPGSVVLDGSDRRIDDAEVLDDGVRVWKVRFSLPYSPFEHVTGFGERYDQLDQRGTSFDNQVFEQYKDQGTYRRTYMPMPFTHVVGGRGWGFHVRTTRRVWFDVGVSQPGRILVEAEVDTPSGAAELLHVSWYDGSPDQVLQAYLTEVGKPELLPDWVFTLWASSNEWNTQAQVERQIRLHEEHRIPVGNLVIEAWSDETTFTIFRDARYEVHEDGSPFRLADFTYPADGAWPDPKGMVDALHEKGVHVHLWQIPLLKMRPHPAGQARADAQAGLSEGVLVQERTPTGKLRPYRNRGWWFPLALMPDLTDERAAQWWVEKRRYLVDEVGIDGFKTDGGEHAWGADLVYLDGRTGDEKNNVYPVAYAASYGRLLQACGKAQVTFSRSGYSGSQAHGAFWAGDENSTWEAFRHSMLAGLNASACGIVYWGWDIAGFSGPIPEAELYVRAMAASAFVPIMQYHSEFNHHRKRSRDRTPWNIAEQWGDDAVIDEVREIVALRERLIPYLACQAVRAVDKGRPLMRPLYFDYPDDQEIWDYPIQWKVGDILVAPVLVPGVETWPVYLPPGEWVDAWTGKTFSGGRVVESRTPRHRIPAYVAVDHWEDLRPVFRG